jgi:octanoyl-[GcvH]:protein N-octanoyltransferase
VCDVRAALARESFPDDPARELAVSHALLLRASAGETGPVVRVYRPGPTVAFGRLDAIRPGFAKAVESARTHGFAPAIRAPGGHAAAYHAGCLCVDEIVPETDPITGLQDRFAARAELFAGALASLGVDARIGEVPGEYCPGAFSVNAGGARKLVGTAQRVIRGAWLFGSVVVVADAAPLERVLADVSRPLGLAWRPEAFGAVADEAPGATVDRVETAIAAAYATRYDLVDGALDDDTLETASRLIERHVIGAPQSLA